MGHSISSRTLTTGILLFAMPTILLAYQSFHREIQPTKEKELAVSLDISFGTLILERGTKDKIAVIDYDQDEDEKQKIMFSYDVVGDEGQLKIKIKRSKSFWGDDDSENHGDRKLRLKLSNALPISFRMELGAGKGEIDVTGLSVREFKLSTGASSVEVKCDEPNPIIADDIEIESGVSKLTATGLCNLNFREMKFSGGVGSYKLDFGGTLKRDANAKIEVGLGAVSVYLPRGMAAKVMYDENWFSNFDLADDFTKQRNGVYVSDNYGDEVKRLSLKIESGLGSVKVRRK